MGINKTWVNTFSRLKFKMLLAFYVLLQASLIAQSSASGDSFPPMLRMVHQNTITQHHNAMCKQRLGEPADVFMRRLHNYAQRSKDLFEEDLKKRPAHASADGYRPTRRYHKNDAKRAASAEVYTSPRRRRKCKKQPVKL